MEIMRIVSQRLAGKFVDAAPRRLAASLRRRRRSLRPMAEGLEVRSLLSVGLDPSFGFGGTAQINLPSTQTNRVFFEVTGIALQAGQVVAVGTEDVDTYSSTGVFVSSTSMLAVARLNTNGSLDTTFGTNGAVTIAAPAGVTFDPEDIAVQSNSQIVVLATATSGTPDSFVFARLNVNGSLDTSFGTAGIETVPFSLGGTATDADAQSLAIGSDGKIIGAGTVDATNDEFGVARLNSNGTLDTTFVNPSDNTGAGTVVVPFTVAGNPANASASGLAVSPTTHGIVVVGTVTPTVGTNSYIGVAGINPNGVATAFPLVTDSPIKIDTADAVALEGTQIVIAGTTIVQTTPTTFTELDVTRLNANGTLDTTFNGTGEYSLPLTLGGNGYNTTASSITVMPDGTLLVGGNADEQYGDGNAGILVNLTPSGVLNTSYGTNGVALLPETPQGRLLVQGDDKVVFVDDDGEIDRTTAPVPQVFPTPPVLITNSTGKNVTGITVFFNTAVNPGMASNVKLYMVKVGAKGKNFIKIKRATYNASNNSVALQFKGSVKLNKKGYTVIIAASTGIVESGAEILNNGAAFSIFVPATSTM
jgi:uncharacterized delta-60 repeat protein